MPRTGPRRPAITFRLSDAGLAAVEARAEAAGVKRSEMLRRMLAYAEAKMPKGRPS